MACFCDVNIQADSQTVFFKYIQILLKIRVTADTEDQIIGIENYTNVITFELVVQKGRAVKRYLSETCLSIFLHLKAFPHLKRLQAAPKFRL